MANRKASDKAKRSPKTVVAKEKLPVDPNLIEEAVKFINEKANETVYRGSLEIGNYILEKFFGGDIKAASSRNPHKPDSYQTLCGREDLVVSPSSLSRMVRVAAQERFFAEKNFDTASISYTHKAELIKLGDEHQKEKLNLAKKIAEEGLSTRQLTAEIHAIREKSDDTERAISAVQASSYLSKANELLTDTRLNDFFANPEKIAKLLPARKNELKQEAVKLITEMEGAISRYREIVAMLEGAKSE